MESLIWAWSAFVDLISNPVVLFLWLVISVFIFRSGVSRVIAADKAKRDADLWARQEALDGVKRDFLATSEFTRLIAAHIVQNRHVGRDQELIAKLCYNILEYRRWLDSLRTNPPPVPNVSVEARKHRNAIHATIQTARDRLCPSVSIPQLTVLPKIDRAVGVDGSNSSLFDASLNSAYMDANLVFLEQAEALLPALRKTVANESMRAIILGGRVSQEAERINGQS